MPGIVEQVVGYLGDRAPSRLATDQYGIYVRAGNGKSVIITQTAIVAKQATKPKEVASWISSTIQTAVGADTVASANTLFVCDSITGMPVSLTMW